MSVEGQLSDVTLPSLIQMTSAEMRKSVLLLRRGSRQGAIYFEGGAVVHAAAGDRVGSEAIYELLRWREGEFRLENQVSSPQRTIDADVTGLLLEGLRRLDEEQVTREGNGHSAPTKTWSEELAEALAEVRAACQDVQGLVVVDSYGLVLSASLPLGSLDRIRVSMLAPDLWEAFQRSAEKMGRPPFSQMLLRGETGDILVTRLGSNAMLVALARAEADLGTLFSNARQAAERAAGILTRIHWLEADPTPTSGNGVSPNGHLPSPEYLTTITK